MTFRVGQEVVCIHATKWYPRMGETNVVKGKKYTIRGFDGVLPEGTNGIVLEEIVNPVLPYNKGLGEAGFHPNQFRPVVKTNIEIFTAMLAPSPSKVTETV